jgi:hypothetical protein
MMINDNIDVHNGIANGTTAEFVKALSQTVQNLFQFKCLATGILCHEVDQLEFEWQDYDRFKGKFRVDPTQGVQS